MASEEIRGKHAKQDPSQGQPQPVAEPDATVLIGTPDEASQTPEEATAAIGGSPAAEVSHPSLNIPEIGLAAESGGSAAFVGADAAVAEQKPAGSAGKTAAKVIAIIVAVLVLAYGGITLYYQQHFLPRTTIGAYDVSDLSVEEASAKFAEIESGYELQVKGAGLDFTISREDTGLQIDSDKVARQAMDMNPAWEWPYYFATKQSQDLTEAMQATYDKESFQTLVKQKVADLNKDATDPISATIAYDAEAGGFQVVPEKLGTKLDEAAVLAKVEEGALRMDELVEIGEDELLRPPVLEDDERLAQAVKDADALLGAEIDVRLNGQSYDVVGSELISSWIVLNDEIKAVLSEDKLRDWTGEFSKKMNTVGSRREYITPRGDIYVVEGGTYGWSIDYEAFVGQFLEAVKAGQKTTVDVPCVSVGATLPDEHNVDWGSRYIDVNLIRQHAVFYDGGEVIWEADIISGSPDGKHNTPNGVYCINVKESPSKLVGEMVSVTVETKDENGKKKKTTEMQPEYETVVQYWMAFVGNAIGFHDATWQPSFGGDMYASGYGSHGCVNLSYDDAERLYGLVTEGTPVVVHQ